MPITSFPGGSNYGWFQVASPGGPQFGVVSQLHLARPTIAAQLNQMFANGQRRLRIPLLFWRGRTPNGGTLDLVGGQFAPQEWQNLADLLALIKASGFEWVELGFFPEGPGDALHNWTAWDEAAFQAHWNLVANVRQLAVASGLPFFLDLMNEGIPDGSGGQALFGELSKRLWINYTASFWPGQTCQDASISLDPDPARIAQMDATFSGNWPAVLEAHIYGAAAAPGWGSAYSTFVGIHQCLAGTPGAGLPWMINECFYNDRVTAIELARGMQDTGQPVLCRIQYPMTPGQDNVIPLDDSNYRVEGL